MRRIVDCVMKVAEEMKRKEIMTAVLAGTLVVIGVAYMMYTNRLALDKGTGNNKTVDGYKVLDTDAGEIWTIDTLKQSRIMDTSKWDLNKVNIVESADGIPVPVPKGFFASELEGENTVLGGFVIYSGEEPIVGIRDEEGNLIEKLSSYDAETDTYVSAYSTDPDSYWQASCTRNQWVWVPVPDISRIYFISEETGKKKGQQWYFDENGRTIRECDYDRGEPMVNIEAKADMDTEIVLWQNGLQGLTRQQMSDDLEIEFEDTIESIKKYGGFYIRTL